MKNDSELQQIYLDGHGHSQTVANRALYDAGYNDGFASTHPAKAPDTTVGVDHFADGSQPKITGTDIVAQTGLPATPERHAADMAARDGKPVVNPAAPADEVATGPADPATGIVPETAPPPSVKPVSVW